LFGKRTKKKSIGTINSSKTYFEKNHEILVIDWINENFGPLQKKMTVKCALSTWNEVHKYKEILLSDPNFVPIENEMGHIHSLKDMQFLAVKNLLPLLYIVGLIGEEMDIKLQDIIQLNIFQDFFLNQLLYKFH